jgi:DNA polymerase III alpha subunit
MARLFSRYPEALARTLEIADRCRFSLDELTYWLRVFPTEETYLQALVIANLLLLPPDPV